MLHGRSRRNLCPTPVYNQSILSDASDLVQAAYTACVEGQFAQAIAKAEAALSRDPTNERARMILGQALDRSGQPAKAAKAIADMGPIAETRHDLLQLRSSLLRKAGLRSEAIIVASKLVDLKPDDADFHASLGLLYMEVGRYKESVSALQTSVALRQNEASFRYNLALALILGKRNEEAVSVLTELVRLSPDFALGHVCLGEELAKRGQFEAAAESAKMALFADPRSVQAHILLARSLTECTAEPASALPEREAESHLRRAIRLDPFSSLAHSMLGFNLHQSGRFPEAEIEFEKSLQLNPRQGNVYYGLAVCRKHTLEDGSRIERLHKLLAVGGMAPIDRSYIHFALGKILEDVGNYEAALAQFDSGNAIMLELKNARRPFDQNRLESYVQDTIRLFDEKFFESVHSIGSISRLPLIVLGMMRSGTTLVEQILSCHPKIAGAGELTFWPDCAIEMSLDRIDQFGLPEVSDIAHRYLDLLRRIGGEAQRVTDKMPQNTLYLGLIHAVFPEAKIIHCRRNPVDTCLSIYTTPYGISPDFAHSRKNIVSAFKQYLGLMEHWRSVIPSTHLIEVDYESLVTEREAVTRRMIEFVGLNWDDACMHHESNLRSVKTPSRWQVRQPIYQSSISRWKRFEPWLGEFGELLTLHPTT